LFGLVPEVAIVAFEINDFSLRKSPKEKARTTVSHDRSSWWGTSESSILVMAHLPLGSIGIMSIHCSEGTLTDIVLSQTKSDDNKTTTFMTIL
jgi:hypothetical protein